MLVSINDISVNSENIESILASIKHPQQIKMTALSPITYINLNTDEHILKNMGFYEKISRSNRKIVPSKSTNVVKGDRVKLSNQGQALDDSFIYAMILSLEQGKLRQNQTPNEKVIILI